MELFCRGNIVLFFNFLVLEKNIVLYKIKLPSTHLSVRRLQFWLVVNALPPSLPFHYFSATQRNFLPFKLEPLGFSLTGQLRVASQFVSRILHNKNNMYHLLVVLIYCSFKVITNFFKYVLIRLIKRQLLTGQLRKNREVQA